MGAGPRTYRVIGTIGSGRHGDLHLADVVGTGGQVVIEMLAHPTPNLIEKLKAEAAAQEALQEAQAVPFGPPVQLGAQWAVVRDHIQAFSLDIVDRANIELHPGTALAIVNQLAGVLGRHAHGDLWAQDILIDRKGSVFVVGLSNRGDPAADVAAVGHILSALLNRHPDEASDGMALAREMCEADPGRRPDWSQVGHWCDAVRALSRGPRLKTWANRVLDTQAAPAASSLAGTILAEPGARPMEGAVTTEVDPAPGDSISPLDSLDDHSPPLRGGALAADMEAEAAALDAVRQGARQKAQAAAKARAEAQAAEAEQRRARQIAQAKEALARAEQARARAQSEPPPAFAPSTRPPVIKQPIEYARERSGGRGIPPIALIAVAVAVLMVGVTGLVTAAVVVTSLRGGNGQQEEVAQAEAPPPEEEPAAPTATPGLTAGFERVEERPLLSDIEEDEAERPGEPNPDGAELADGAEAAPPVAALDAIDVDPNLTVSVGRAAILRMGGGVTNIKHSEALDVNLMTPYLVLSAPRAGFYRLTSELGGVDDKVTVVAVVENSNTDPEGAGVVGVSERLTLAPNTGAACVLSAAPEQLINVDPARLRLSNLSDRVVYLHAETAQIADAVFSQGRNVPRVITVDATSTSNEQLPKGCVRAPKEAIRVPAGGQITQPVGHATRVVFVSDERIVSGARPEQAPRSVTIRGIRRGSAMVVVAGSGGDVWLRRVIVE